MNSNAEVKSFFDAFAPRWDEVCVHSPQKISAIITLAQVAQGKRVLDIACGTGVLFPEILLRNPAELAGVDLSDGMIEIARGKCGDPRVKLYAQDFLEFSQSGFDVAIIYSAYPHFFDKAALVRHVYDLLAPGGRFMLAHSEGRAAINGLHSGGDAQSVSTGLRPVKEEAEVWQERFTVDLLADNSEIYLISGVK